MKTEYVYSSWHVVIIFNLCMKTLISATFIGSTNLPTRNVFSKQENRNAAVLSVLDKTPCSYILLRRNTTSYDDLTKDLCESKNCQGIAVFEFPPNNDRNATKLNQLLRVIRQIRIRSECAVLIVLNDDPKFLMTLADVSLTQRTLGGSTRFLVVGQLQYQDISYLTTHWIFAMMNTVFIVPSMNLESASWYLYTYLPYSSSENLLAKIGKWTQKKGLILSGGSSVFQEKFTDFHGATVNFTALPYKPYWTDDNLPDGDRVYSGADRQMLEAMASALNFSIYILPVQSWDEVLQRVAERVSFMSPVVHMVLPQRLLRVDFTCTYEHGINIAFAMAKPVLKPQWQSLYYPLSDQVWLYALGVLIITILSFLSVQNGSNLFGEDKSSGIGALVLSVLGSLFGQTFSTRCPTVSSMRVLIAFWLIFVFILGSAYKGNLIAFLVAPRYPPRPETLAELVKVAERVTMPSYGEQFRNFLKSSEFPNFQALGNMLQVGVSVTDGLQLALKYRQSHIDGTRYLELQIAEHFTKADGNSELYVGREGVLPGMNAWPIPHDAPYKENFDKVINAIIEAGLYNKWMKDMLDQARNEGRQKRRALQEKLKEEEDSGGIQMNDDSNSGRNVARPLTIIHLQGPLLLIIIGLGSAGVIFLFEFLIKGFYASK